MLYENRLVANVCGANFAFEDVMRDLAGQFLNGRVTIDDYVESIIGVMESLAKKEGTEI